MKKRIQAVILLGIMFMIIAAQLVWNKDKYSKGLNAAPKLWRELWH